MTSKNLFFKRMKLDLEQRIWLPVVFFIIGFLVTEMPLISELNRWKNRIDYAERSYEYLLNNFFTPNVIITLLVGAVAVVGALSGFVYMHSAKKLDVYHSLPIGRGRLFLQQYVYGILYFIAPMLVHVLLCLLICAANGVMSLRVLGQAVGFFAVELLIYLACYSMVILVICLTGNLVISILGSAVLAGYSGILFAIETGLMEFFETYTGRGVPVAIPAVTPVHLIVNMIMEMSDVAGEYFVYTDHMLWYAKLILAAVVYTVIALLLYQKRPTEAAGRTMAFAITEPVVKTMVVFPVSILSGYLFLAIIRGGFVAFVFGCVFGFVIACPLMEIIFRKDVKAVFAHPLQLVFNGVLVLAVVFAVEFDLLGYDTYIPDEDRVESYALDFGDLGTIYSSYGNLYEYRFDNMTITDNESTRKLLEHAASFTRPLDRGEYEERVEAGQIRTSYFTVKYNLKNGKEVYRGYQMNLADEQVMQWLADTYNDMQYKLGVYPILSENREQKFMGVVLECAYANEEIPLSEADMKEFIEVYRRELTNLSFEELLREAAVAKLNFAIQPNYEENDYPVAATETRVSAVQNNLDHYVEERGYMIYPSFTQTIALLEKYGAKFVNEIPAEDVLEIRITDYSREAYDENGMLDKVLEVSYSPANGQTAEVAELLPVLVDNQMLCDFRDKRSEAEYWDIRVRYLHEDMEMSAYMNIRNDEIPTFLLEDLQELAGE